MVTVICLQWHNYLGRGIEYVDKLLNGCRRNITEPVDFYEITERDFPASEKREGWWLKLALFEMFNEPADTKLYLDLDVVLCANIDHLIALARTDKSKLWMRDDFSYSMINPRPDLDDSFKKLLGGPGTCQSSVMLWHRAPDLRGADALMNECHGDQNVITKLLWPKGIALLPNDSIKSFKYHPGETAPIVCFHGAPKMHEITEDYVLRHWR